jgi:hypothetical protein
LSVDQHKQLRKYCPMDDARHHRDQAERWLEMARHMSDPLAANLLRDAAARHLAQARELEEQVRAGRSQSPEAPEERLSDFSDSFYYRAMRTAIGGALRDELAPTEPTPGRLSNALKALDGPKSGDAGGNDEEGEGPPGHQEGKSCQNRRRRLSQGRCRPAAAAISVGGTFW